MLYVYAPRRSEVRTVQVDFGFLIASFLGKQRRSVLLLGTK